MSGPLYDGPGPEWGTGRAAGAISTRKCNFKALRLKVDERKGREELKPEKISERTKEEAESNVIMGQ